jgi:hypothetical protein
MMDETEIDTVFQFLDYYNRNTNESNNFKQQLMDALKEHIDNETG